MTTTDADTEGLAGHGEEAPRARIDDPAIWEAIGRELLSRDSSTLRDTLRDMLKPPLGTARRNKEEREGEPKSSPQEDALGAALEESLAGKDVVETLDNIIEAIRDPRAAFDSAVEAARDREADSDAPLMNAAERSKVAVLIEAARKSGTSKAATESLEAEAEQALYNQFEVASGSPEQISFLATYLYARHLKIWEDTSDWDGIRKLMKVTREAFERVAHSLDEDTELLVGAVICLIESISPAMDVESGLNCSCPVTMQHAAETVMDQAISILRSLGTAPEGDSEDVLNETKTILRGSGISADSCKEFIRSRAAVDLVYFNAVSAVGGAVGDYIDAPGDLDTKLADAIEQANSAESYIKGDVYESELRSHRLGLESLRTAWPRLHVERAKVIYCYPFAVPWADPASLIEAAQEHADSWEFSGLEAHVSSMELTDMWDGQVDDEKLFAGVAIAFPKEQDPIVRPKAQEILGKHEVPDERFSLEIRLSRIGNHYLRMEQPLNDATIHDLNQAMRRAMQQMGAERVLFNERIWPRLYDLAQELIDELVNYLEPYVAKNELGADRHANESEGADSGPARKAYPHVIVTARKLSLRQEGLGEDDPLHGDLTSEVLLSKAKGVALLVQPVRQAAAVLEEWSRYTLPDLNDGNAIQPMSFTGNFGYRTVNTTFGLLRGTPEYLIVEHEEAAEFVASLPVLLESWMGQISQRASNGLRDDATTEEIANRQLQLRRILTRATTVIAQIHSPDLCLTAIHRKDLDQMFEIAGIERLEKELQSHFTVLNAHLDTLAAMAAERERKKTDMQGFFFGAGAVLVGVPSLAAVFALFDTGFAVHRRGDLIEAIVLTSLIVLLFFAVLKLPGAKDVGHDLHLWAKKRFKGRQSREPSADREANS